MNSNDDISTSILQITTFGLLFIGFLINCFILVHLYFSKMKYPYTCIPTYWLIIFLISLNINSIFPVLGIEIGGKDDSDIKNLMQFIDLFLIKFLVMIPIIANYFSISQILKYNYYHLTRHIYHFGKEGLIKPKSYSKFYKKRYRYYKGFCFVYCLLFLFFVILYFFCRNDYYKIEEPNKVILILLPFIFLSFYLLILSRIWKYQFSNDKYLLLFESITLFLIFFIEINTFFFALPYSNRGLFQNESSYYLFDSIFNLLKSIIIALTTIIRKKRFCNDDDDIVKNKSLIEFLSMNVNFQMFRAYVRQKEKDDINLLTFWTDYNMFVSIDKNVAFNSEAIANKRSEDQRDNFTRTTSEDLIIKKGETTLKEKAMQIYNDFFKTGNSFNSSNKSSSKFSIVFPTDIREKIEEYSKNGFEMDNLGSIYDGAYAWVLEKLETLYKSYKLQTSEIEKLRKNTFFDKMLEIPVNE